MIERILIFSDEKSRIVKFIKKKKQLTIIITNSNSEIAQESIEISSDKTNEFELGLNIIYLFDILKSLECKKINLFYLDENSPIKIESDNELDAKNFLMPYKI